MIQSEPKPVNDPVTDILLDKLLQSPVFDQKVNERIDQKVEQKVSEILSDPKIYTEKQMGEMYHKCKASINRMSDEQLNELGYVRLKVGVNNCYQRVRFNL
jgi:hypothetical protein